MSLRPRTSFVQYRGHERVSEPDVEPVTPSELADQLRLDAVGDEETYLETLITAAREQAEEVTGRALITQKWRLTLDYWPSQRGEPWWDGVRQGAISELFTGGKPAWVILPRYRLHDVDSITTFDQSGNSSSVDVSEFIVDTAQEPGRLVLKNATTWPVALQRANAIEIEYTAGYGGNPEDVPAALRLAILQYAAFLYENRGDCPAESAMHKSGAWPTFKRYMVQRV